MTRTRSIVSALRVPGFWLPPDMGPITGKAGRRLNFVEGNSVRNWEFTFFGIAIYTMWDPPVISWFISPSNYSYFRTINHSYWSYLHQLSYLTGASLIVGICVWELWTWICPSLGISWWIQWIHGFRRSGSVRSTHHGHQLPPNSGDHPSKSCFGWRWFFDHGVIYLISNSKNGSAMVLLCLRSVMCFLYFPLVSFSKNMLEKCC